MIPKSIISISTKGWNTVPCRSRYHHAYEQEAVAGADRLARGVYEQVGDPQIGSFQFDLVHEDVVFFVIHQGLNNRHFSLQF